MLYKLGVSLVAMPLTIAKLVVASRTAKIAAIMTLIVYVSSRDYRPGEGPLSLKIPVTIAPGEEGLGGILYELSTRCIELRDFWEITFRITRSEARSIGILVQASLESDSALPALVDFLRNFPRK